MGQIFEGSIDAQKIAKNLIEVIVSEALKTLKERTEHHFDSLQNLKLQNLGNEEIIDCVKSEGMNLEGIKMESSNQASTNIYIQNPEECIQCSMLSTQGEGDFQPPFVRETKAFHHLESEDSSCPGQTSINSSHSSVYDDLIAQLHVDINSISFDNINLSDSEVEKELQTTDLCYLEPQIKVNQWCQTNRLNHPEEELDSTNEKNNHDLKHSQKFSHLNEHLQYYRLKENDLGNEECQDLISVSSEELTYIESKKEGPIDNSSQTNPYRNPFLICSDVNSTIALTSDCREIPDEDISTEAGGTQEDNEWVEANEVQIKITEPGSSKECLQADGLEIEDCAVKSRHYWSNVGLITEHTVDRRYLGPEEIPGIDTIKGVPKVQERYLTNEPEKVIWISEAETLEKPTYTGVSQGNTKTEDVNYLCYPKKNEVEKKKKTFASRLSKVISSVFKISNKGPKE